VHGVAAADAPPRVDDLSERGAVRGHDLVERSERGRGDGGAGILRADDVEEKVLNAATTEGGGKKARPCRLPTKHPSR
jgi:hypothetical protein